MFYTQEVYCNKCGAYIRIAHRVYCDAIETCDECIKKESSPLEWFIYQLEKGVT
jgi:hypothetical protein